MDRWNATVVDEEIMVTNSDKNFFTALKYRSRTQKTDTFAPQIRDLDSPPLNFIQFLSMLNQAKYDRKNKTKK